jgi:hypothetical protein
MRVEGKTELSKATQAELARECEELREEITRLCDSVPPHVLNGSFQAVIEWKHNAIRALKTAQNANSGYRDLRSMRFVMLEMRDPEKFVYPLVG